MSSKAATSVNKALKSIRLQIAQGIVDAACEIQRQAVKKTPVDTGNLRKSAHICLDGNKTTTPRAVSHTRIVTVRFDAPYALFVHNASGSGRGKPRRPPHLGKYWDPIGAEPQFLIKSYNAVIPQLNAYIARRIKQVYSNA